MPKIVLDPVSTKSLRPYLPSMGYHLSTRVLMMTPFPRRLAPFVLILVLLRFPRVSRVSVISDIFAFRRQSAASTSTSWSSCYYVISSPPRSSTFTSRPDLLLTFSASRILNFVVVKLVCRTPTRSSMYMAVLSRFFVVKRYFFASFRE
jgi:hypothetical protein